MMRFTHLMLLLCFTFASAAGLRLPSANSADLNSPEPNIAVVELFTSQGCSSCPPADAVLKQLSTQTDENGKVFVLSFHVDYWNRLGWTDPYSSSLASDRQRAYASGFGSNRVYTPQMIVGGTQEFVGSNPIKAKTAVRHSLQQAAKASVALTTRVGPDSIDVTYKVTGATSGDVLNVALVQNARPIAVNRGENNGKRLGHANVVRHFEHVRLNDQPSGNLTVKLPKGFDAADSSVIAYVQNSKTLAITGAVSNALAKN